MLGKTAGTQQFNGGSPATGASYNLSSSVTGTVIAEYFGAGTKIKASVYAGRTVIAQHLNSTTSPNIVFEHTNPVTRDGINTNTSGVAGNRTTPDPDGISTGDIDPFIDPYPEDPIQKRLNRLTIV